MLGNEQSETCRENHSEAEQLKRYQLACQLADLYEQYLIFRPEWIHAWHQGEFIAYDQADQADECDSGIQSSAIWQGKLWHLLVSEQPYDPHELVALAISNLSNIDLTDKTNPTIEIITAAFIILRYQRYGAIMA